MTDDRQKCQVNSSSCDNYETLEEVESRTFLHGRM